MNSYHRIHVPGLISYFLELSSTTDAITHLFHCFHISLHQIFQSPGLTQTITSVTDSMKMAGKHQTVVLIHLF